MKNPILLFLALICWLGMDAQNIVYRQADSLLKELQRTRSDTARALIMCQLAEAYRSVQVDSTLYFSTEALELSRRNHFPKAESKALSSLCSYFYTTGNYPAALDAGLKALKIAQEYNLRYDQAFAMIRIGNVHVAMNDLENGLRYYEETRALVRNTPDSFFYAVTFWLAADVYEKMNKPDSALSMALKAQDTAIRMNNSLILSGLPRILGNIYARKGDRQKALQYFHLRLPDGVRSKLRPENAEACSDLAKYHNALHQTDSAILYATKAYELSTVLRNARIRFSSAELLSKLLDSQNVQKSHQYLKIANAIRDSLFGVEKMQELQAISYREKERQNELALAQEAFQNRIRQYALLSGMGLLVLVSLGLYRNNRTKQKANKALQEQKIKVEEALTRLKSAQAQLVQSEKMASLGELTAGIAHEIQNPLNFVNNFADVNSELIDELQEDLKKGDIRAATATAENLKENEEKIKMHGKRADGIVKSMLQHSHGGSGQKVLSDVNRLVDEYIRMAYHGFRSRCKDVNVDLDIHLDPQAGSVQMVPQELGRVILNLLNNAFYAVQEHSKSAGPDFKPLVSIRTAANHHSGPENGHSKSISIEIADNGNGIPGNIRDKIFQPFFTTKPTGQGTGLGLSLSYDIVTKGHGGSLTMETTEGFGSSFIINLPVNV